MGNGMVDDLVDEVCEGYIIKHLDGSLWVAKGCYHLSDGLVAVPRLYGGVKIKRLNDAYSIIMRYYRHYVRFVRELGRYVPVVPLRDVSVVVSPLDVVRRVKELGRVGLINTAVELLDLIVYGCGCTAGFSGSLAGGYFREDSDIDIVVYSNTSKCYELLRRLRSEGVLKPMDRNLAYIEYLEVGEGGDEGLIELMMRRVLQGVFKGYRYTIRLINCEDPGTLVSDYVVIPDETLILRVVDNSHSYTTPAIYWCELISPTTYYSSRVKLVTHRIRYSELGVGTLLRTRTPLYVLSNYNVVNLDIADLTHII